MSLALQPVAVRRILDPRTAVNEAREFTFVSSGVNNTFYQYPSTQYNTSSVQWSIQTPSPSSLLDKKMYMRISLTFTFSGSDLGTPLISLGSDDGLRHLPFQNCVETASLQLNNMSTAINSRDIMETLLRYDSNFIIEDHELSLFPSQQDQFQKYEDWNTYGLARNPLAFYGENSAQQTRGASVFYTVNSNTNTAASITCTWCEPLLISPLQAGRGDSNALASIQNVTINLSLGSLSRGWSHNNDSRVITISDVAFASAPVLLTNSISTNDVQEPVLTNRIYQYNYASYDRYPTNLGSISAGSSATYQTQNIQLNNIPNRIWIMARQRNQDQTFISSDVFAYLTNLNITWDNRVGLLSTMAPEQLYEMSVRNGLNMSWAQWAFFVGSPICVQFGYDISLSPVQASGMQYNSQLQVQCTVKNLGSESVNFDLYIIVETKGIYNTQGVSANAQLGVLSQKDVLDAGKNPLLDYGMNQRVALLGGNIFSDIGNAFKSAYNYVAPHAVSAVKKYGPALAERGLRYALTGTGTSASGLVGGSDVGLVGGKRRKRKGRGLSGSALPSGKISREDLKKRLERAVASGTDTDSDDE